MKIGMNRLSLFIVLFTISILSITGMYAYALFDVTSVGEIENDSDKLLDGVLGTAIYTVGDSTYVIAASENEHGIEIIDISDPTSPTSVGRLADDGTKLLNKSVDVATFILPNYLNAHTGLHEDIAFAAVAGSGDNGIEMVNISDPTNLSDTYRQGDGVDTGVCTAANGERCLGHVSAVAIATIDGKTYVVAAGQADDGIEIIEVTTDEDNENIFQSTVVGRIVDDGTTLLNFPNDVAIATIDGKTYAVVAAAIDDGIEIIDISDPTSPVPVSYTHLTLPTKA